MIKHDIERRQQTSRQQRKGSMKPCPVAFWTGAIALIVLAALMLSASAIADEKSCLTSIMYAESRGESIEHNVVIGQAAIQKANKESTTLCRLKGVKKLTPDSKIRRYYEQLAATLIKEKSTHLSKGADHWNKGVKPALPGKVTRQIDNHVFYVLDSRK